MLPLTASDHIRETILDYLKTTFRLSDKAVEAALLEFLQDNEHGMFKGPYVDLRLPFQKSLGQEKGGLTIAPPFTPYVHQDQAFERLNSANGQPLSTLITTGTGSGKTECFLYPLLDHCYRHRNEAGIKGIILYPMNALASDQATRLAKEINGHDQLRGQIRAGLYVGGRSDNPHKQMGPDYVIDDRDTLRNDPPDILLTNFKMLDFLLVRPDDRSLWQQNQPNTLQYLILDELHTFDGAQGSDVACLIRRLKARLQTPAGYLCPVGTSATVAGGEGESTTKLTEFASQIFGEPFLVESVITETRQPLRDFIPPETDEQPRPVSELPPVGAPADKANLQAVPGEESEKYLERQMMLWFGELLDPVQLGIALLGHNFLITMLRATLDSEGESRGALLLDDLLDLIAQRDVYFKTLAHSNQVLLTQSFLSLLSYARRVDGGRTEPFLTVQSQVWVREMSRLMRQVVPDGVLPQFFWRDDHSPELPPLGLPAYVCRECGHTGWLSSMQKGDERLARDTKIIYANYFSRSPNVRYIYPAGSGLTYQEYLDPNTLRIHTSRTDENGGSFVPVVIHSKTSQNTKNPRDLQRCPVCENDQTLTILGRQAASLLSVAIGYLFTSPINNDKKLLAFTDSVQDASHRAAFFGQRTYRFSLRTAIQSMLDEDENGMIPLPDMTDRLLSWLREKLAVQMGEAYQSSIEQKLVATLVPPDLQDLSIYRNFVDNAHAAQQMAPALANMIQKRVSWEITTEYGFNANLGRSLEVVGSSAGVVRDDIFAQAINRLHAILEEEISASGTISLLDTGYFVWGLITRSRLRGGVDHSLLKRYVESGGNWYLLTRKQNQFLSPFYRQSPRFPRFLTDSGSKTFDTYTTQGSAQTWFVGWARKSLSLHLSLQQINDAYRRTIQVLVDHQILTAYRDGTKQVFAIQPSALMVTREVTQIMCDMCSDTRTVATSQQDRWLNAPCTSYRCDGKMVKEKSTDQSYYRTMYASGKVERIFSAEHTGLLPRSEREEIERLFKTQPKMDAPNLLVATPTLEMGIDVGDLSATLACSVPPRPANYLQRIGRAGRKTGNALILTVANARDHDLYFFEEPAMMLKGEIIPPGCFLDAPEMLKRQLFAHALDTWTAASNHIKRLPNDVRGMVSSYKRGEFPADFLEWFSENQARTTVQFLDLLTDELSESARDQLYQFGTDQSLPARITEAIDQVIQQKEELRKDIRTLRADQKKIEQAPARYDNPELDINEIQQEVRVLNKAIKNLDAKYVLNFFADASLLPNYAFPEPGIELKAIISGFESPARDADTPGYELYEFERAAAQGIRELAPFNTFYAFGRKMEVGRIDVKHRESTVESWQFCPSCSMMAPVSKIHHSPTCPKCGSTQWADHGQRHDMILLRGVESRVSDQNSRAGDEGDERERELYETQVYFEVDPEQSAGGWLIPSLPFGFETLNQLTLREINFGLAEGFGAKQIIAGEEVQETGFRVCPGCGEVEDMSEKEGTSARATHARTCPHYRRYLQSKKEIPWQKLYLYRELQTEGLRILLPVSNALTPERVESFKAALQLGLRLEFGGVPDHLSIDVHTEIDQSGAKRRFVMIYDTVPGGTSYLRDFGQPLRMRSLLSRAYQHIQSCKCALREGLKGCHLCLYSPRTGKEREHINRTDALQTISQILNDWEALEQTISLGQADISNVVESELEMRFVHLLEKIGSECRGWKWQPLIANGKEVFDLETPGMRWRVEPQVTVGPRHGVQIASKPDFLLTPKNGVNRKSIALFLDGHRYHVQPNEVNSRLADDMRKRRSLIESSNYLVWSLTWDDLDRFEKKKTDDLLSPLFPESLSVLDDQLSRRAKIDLNSEVFSQDGLSQLLPLLESYRLSDWELLAQLSALAAVVKGRPAVAEAVVAQATDQLLHYPQSAPLNFQGSPSGPLRYTVFDNDLLQLFCWVAGKNQVKIIMRLNDSQAERQLDRFNLTWQRFLHHLNVWQFLEHFQPVTASLISEEAVKTPVAPLVEVEAAHQLQDQDAAWGDVGDDVIDEVVPLVDYMVRTTSTPLPLPVVGFELVDNQEQIVGMAELGWLEQRVALLLLEQQLDQSAFSQAGWDTVLFELSGEEDIKKIGDQLVGLVGAKTSVDSEE